MVFELAAALLFAFLFVMLSVPSVIRMAEQKRWFDEPSSIKKHTRAVSKLGGFAIFGGVIFSVLMFVDKELFTEFRYPLAGFVILFLAGFLDDINPITPWQKLLVQLLAAVILVVPGNITLASFYGFLGLYELPYSLIVLSSVFLMVAISNAYNSIDGVDLLATINGFWVTLIIGLWLYLTYQFNSAVIAIAVSGALAAFVYFNSPPAKIFLGDSGTMPIGMLIAMLLIKSVETAGVYEGRFAIANAPVLAYSLVAIPVFDLARLSYLRMIKGRSPFSGDRNHIHHSLLDKGWSHLQTSLAINIAGVIVFVLTLLFSLVIKNINLLMFLSICVTALSVFILLILPKKVNLRSREATEV